MADIELWVQGCAGRVTLNRPEALNALNETMCRALAAALLAWRDEPAVALVVIDAAGARAFCAGGDIAEIYALGRAGNFGQGQRFWRDEYRMNAMIAAYPKPVVSLMQGFTMGGGVGVGCHASHRIAGETTQIAMPECGIGLVPDVGGSYLLARGPGRLGEYLGVTGARMGPGDAIFAGFADLFVPQARWPDLIARLEQTGDVGVIAAAAEPAPEGRLPGLMSQINAHFGADTLADIARSLRAGKDTEFAAQALAAVNRVSPLAAACAVEMQHRLGDAPTLPQALELEYRFTARAQAQGDFLEGIRAAIIDKDRKPRWLHAGPEAVPDADVARMLMPLGAEGWTLEDKA